MASVASDPSAVLPLPLPQASRPDASPAAEPSRGFSQLLDATSATTAPARPAPSPRQDPPPRASASREDPPPVDRGRDTPPPDQPPSAKDAGAPADTKNGPEATDAGNTTDPKSSADHKDTKSADKASKESDAAAAGQAPALAQPSDVATAASVTAVASIGVSPAVPADGTPPSGDGKTTAAASAGDQVVAPIAPAVAPLPAQPATGLLAAIAPAASVGAALASTTPAPDGAAPVGAVADSGKPQAPAVAADAATASQAQTDGKAKPTPVAARGTPAATTSPGPDAATHSEPDGAAVLAAQAKPESNPAPSPARAAALADAARLASSEPRNDGATPAAGGSNAQPAANLTPSFNPVTPAGVQPIPTLWPVTPLRVAAAADAGVPLSGVAVEIAARVHDGQKRFDIRLDPPELGRIEVRLNVDGGGRVTSHLLVDRAETLDVLRRDASTLERALQSAGLKTDDGAMQFSLRDQSFAGRDQGAYAGAAPIARLIVPDAELPPLDAALRRYGQLMGLGSGVDIRV